jgi:putative transcriptional regulator
VLALNNRIKEARKALGYTQSDLAKLVGVRRETIARIEANLYNPSLLLAAKLAVACKQELQELFLFESEDIALNTK